jgi:predicted HAD superfamily phosphohydrolase YqeG
MKLKLNIKALFFDLRQTLVSFDDKIGKYVEFPETNIILRTLKENGIEIDVISAVAGQN